MHLLSSLLSAFAASVFFATAVYAEVISPHQAMQHVGEEVTVEGKVSQVSRSSGGTTFVNFGGRFPDHVFYAVVFMKRAYMFPEVSELEGRDVAITGRIEIYKGKPQIILSSPDQVDRR